LNLSKQGLAAHQALRIAAVNRLLAARGGGSLSQPCAGLGGATRLVTTPVGLRRSALRSRLKIVRLENFNPAVCAWMVHRPPAGRLARPIKTLRDALHCELQALPRG
jgi:hypothetical protein